MPLSDVLVVSEPATIASSPLAATSWMEGSDLRLSSSSLFYDTQSDEILQSLVNLVRLPSSRRDLAPLSP